MRSLKPVGPLCCVVVLVSCSGGTSSVGTTKDVVETPTLASTGPSPSGQTPQPSRTSGGNTKNSDDDVVVVRYSLERRVNDPATENFFDVVVSTLTDPRGWERADFELIRDPNARFRVILAEGNVVDRLCLPYETRSTYSCQNGPVVALNADRWRTATPQWTGTLPAYRRMLVNHEVGHLLGQHHPDIQCPAPGQLAPIMAQQSTELNGCLPNPWPLAHEIKKAARHRLPLAPPYEEDP